MADTPLELYRDLVHRGELAPDPAQKLATEKLQLLASRLGGLAQPARGALLAPLLRKRREAPKGSISSAASAAARPCSWTSFLRA